METITAEQYLAMQQEQDHNRKLGGKRAKVSGDLAERLFEVSCNRYKDNGRIDWHKTFPEIVITERGMRGQVTGFPKEKATADYVGSVTELNGKTFWVEVKNVRGVNRKSISKTYHQYRQMKTSMNRGAMAFYLLRWHNDDFVEWRLYPLRLITTNENETLTFKRDDGYLCQSVDDCPLWLDVALEIK